MSVQSINRNQNESIYSKTAKAAGIGGAAGAAGSYLRLYSRLQDRKDEFLPGQAVINEYAKQEAEKIHNSPEAAALKKISEELAAQAQETAPDEVKLKTISDDLAAWTKENLPEDETLKKISENLAAQTKETAPNVENVKQISADLAAQFKELAPDAETIAQKMKENSEAGWKELKSVMFTENLKEAGKIGLLAACFAGLGAAVYHFMKSLKNQEN